MDLDDLFGGRSRRGRRRSRTPRTRSARAASATGAIQRGGRPLASTNGTPASITRRTVAMVRALRDSERAEQGAVDVGRDQQGSLHPAIVPDTFGWASPVRATVGVADTVRQCASRHRDSPGRSLVGRRAEVARRRGIRLRPRVDVRPPRLAQPGRRAVVLRGPDAHRGGDGDVPDPARHVRGVAGRPAPGAVHAGADHPRRRLRRPVRPRRRRGGRPPALRRRGARRAGAVGQAARRPVHRVRRGARRAAHDRQVRLRRRVLPGPRGPQPARHASSARGCRSWSRRTAPAR